MKTTRTAALALGLAALAGCGTTAAAHPSAPAAPSSAPVSPGYAAGAANPVPILRLTGCPIPAGTVNGTIGADENRVAGCTFGSSDYRVTQEQIYVFHVSVGGLPGQPDRAPADPANGL